MSDKRQAYNLEKRELHDVTPWRKRYMVANVVGTIVLGCVLLPLSFVTTWVGVVAIILFFIDVLVLIFGSMFIGINCLDFSSHDHVFKVQRWWLERRGLTLINRYSSGTDGEIKEVLEIRDSVADYSREFPEIDTLARLYVSQKTLVDKWFTLQGHRDQYSTILSKGQNVIARDAISAIDKDQTKLRAAMREVWSSAYKIAATEEAARVAIKNHMLESRTLGYHSDVDRLAGEALSEAQVAKQYIISRDS